MRLRPESFADHCYHSGPAVLHQPDAAEQRHIANALAASNSARWRRRSSRERVVSHLMNIDETLASTVPPGFWSRTSTREPADAAVETRQDLDPSPALSIVLNGPKRFEGRKLGILVTDGVDAALLKALVAALTRRRRWWWRSSLGVGGVTASDGGLGRGASR